MNPFVINLAHSKWSAAEIDGNRFLLKGHAYLCDRSASLQDLAEYIGSAATTENLSVALQQLNGFYSWVYQKEDCLFVGTDHVRSFPIFFGQAQGQFFLSDDAEWVREQVDDLEMEILAKEEFLLSGYVTGPDTLYKNVKQLQAGEFLKASYAEGAIQVDCGRYYRFSHVEPQIYDENELEKQLDFATCNSMRRLIEYAAGRQIVVPLSGGYDSRLIVSMLKKLDYTNVLCFTYGIRGNKEAEYSRRIAASLNFKWEFVEYSTALWRDAWSTAEAREYKRMAANHASLPHVQDWLAIRCLIRNGILTGDVVVAPGHSGDFVAGSHIPEFIFSKNRHSKKSLLQALIKNHFSNAPSIEASSLKSEKLEARLQNRIGADFNDTDVGVANLYEMWDWQERQAKYIVNSVRVYDQFALNWWLPQWDLEFVRFWETVPLLMRRRRLWFKTWIGEQYASAIVATAIKTELKNASDTSTLYRVLLGIAGMLPVPVRNVAKRLRRQKIYKDHFLAFEGLVNPSEFDAYLKKGHNIIGIYSDLYMKNKW